MKRNNLKWIALSAILFLTLSCGSSKKQITRAQNYPKTNANKWLSTQVPANSALMELQSVKTSRLPEIMPYSVLAENWEVQLKLLSPAFLPGTDKSIRSVMNRTSPKIIPGSERSDRPDYKICTRHLLQQLSVTERLHRNTCMYRITIGLGTGNSRNNQKASQRQDRCRQSDNAGRPGKRDTETSCTKRHVTHINRTNEKNIIYNYQLTGYCDRFCPNRQKRSQFAKHNPA